MQSNIVICRTHQNSTFLHPRRVTQPFRGNPVDNLNRHRNHLFVGLAFQSHQIPFIEGSQILSYFKFGGSFTLRKIESGLRLQHVIVRHDIIHTVRFCQAFHNRSVGFDNMLILGIYGKLSSIWNSLNGHFDSRLQRHYQHFFALQFLHRQISRLQSLRICIIGQISHQIPIIPTSVFRIIQTITFIRIKRFTFDSIEI